MNRRCLKFSFVYTLIVIALPRAINGSELATRSENQIAMFDAKEGTNNDFSYILKSVTTKPCILANMNITINVPYKTKNKIKGYRSLEVPHDDVKIDGHCSATISYMNITWNSNDADKEKNSIKFTFINDHTNFSLFSIDLNIYRDKKNFQTATDKNQWFKATSDIDLRLFVTPVENGIHKCDETALNVEEANVLMKNVSLIAFNRNDNLTSRQEIKCSKEKETETFPYVLRDENNNICTMARMSILVTVPFRTKESKTGIANVHVPTSNVHVSGECSGTLVTMTLTWSVPSSKEKNQMSFVFTKKEKTSELFAIKVEIFTDEENFKDVERLGELIEINTEFGISLFPAPVVNGIHSCPKQTNVTTTRGNITVSDVLLVAFDAEKDFASKKVTDCRRIVFEDDFSYVVRQKDTNIPCTLANMSITTLVHKKNSEVKSHVPANAIATGICADKYSQMVLSWPTGKLANNITFHIGRNKTHFFVTQIAATIYPDEGADNNRINGTSYTGIDLFSAAVANEIYRCSNPVNVELDDIRLTINDVAFVAFYTEETDVYLANVTVCPNPEPIESTSTISTPEPTSTPKPEDRPDYNYVVKNSTSNVAYIAANMSIFLKIPYKTTENKDEKVTLIVPSNASATGEWKDKWSMMELNWIVNGNKENNTVTVNFEKDDSNYYIHSMNLFIYLDDHNFPNHTEKTYNTSTERLDEFSIPLNNVYKCALNTSIVAKSATILITDVALIAFNTNQNITNLKSVDCAGNNDDTSESNVGAIVGGVIGGLIILVGVIFLVVLWRRRRY